MAPRYSFAELVLIEEMATQGEEAHKHEKFKEKYENLKNVVGPGIAKKYKGLPMLICNTNKEKTLQLVFGSSDSNYTKDIAKKHIHPLSTQDAETMEIVRGVDMVDKIDFYTTQLSFDFQLSVIYFQSCFGELLLQYLAADGTLKLGKEEEEKMAKIMQRGVEVVWRLW
eukprot:720879-Rhodomonas_salina.1